ncbi:hypothetical protein HQ447_01955, partial [bacterium]|nr:hypothetical protein [bacterium]
MAHPQHLDNEFSSRFFADILQLYPESSRQYRCTGISDIHYAVDGHYHQAACFDPKSKNS